MFLYLGSPLSALESRQNVNKNRTDTGKPAADPEGHTRMRRPNPRRGPSLNTLANMDHGAYEIRIEYEEEVEVRTELRVETLDSTGWTPLHRRRWCHRQRATRRTGPQTPTQHCDREQAHPRDQGGSQSGKSTYKVPNARSNHIHVLQGR